MGHKTESVEVKKEEEADLTTAANLSKRGPVIFPTLDMGHKWNQSKSREEEGDRTTAANLPKMGLSHFPH